MITKTHIRGQKPRGRQLNAKVCGHESAIFLFLFLSSYDHDVQQRYLANGSSTHRHFSTKLILITTRSSTSTQRLDSFKFTLVNKSHSQHSVVAVRCEGRHFFTLYACAHEVSFHWPNTTLISLGTTLVPKRNDCARLARSLPVVVGKVYEHRIGKALQTGVKTMQG